MLDEVGDEGIYYVPLVFVGEPVQAPSVVQLGKGCRWWAGPSDRRRHPLTAPSTRAAMTCRWNRMNTRIVGSRIRMVPALSSGMSVA